MYSFSTKQDCKLPDKSPLPKKLPECIESKVIPSSLQVLALIAFSSFSGKPLHMSRCMLTPQRQFHLHSDCKFVTTMTNPGCIHWPYTSSFSIHQLGNQHVLDADQEQSNKTLRKRQPSHAHQNVTGSFHMLFETLPYITNAISNTVIDQIKLTNQNSIDANIGCQTTQQKKGKNPGSTSFNFLYAAVINMEI
jgi:hypothetical protein